MSETNEKTDANDGDGTAGTFDASLGRLEEIVVELEEGKLGLESSLERYEEGAGLLADCRERLAKFRAQVEELKTSGEIVPHGNDPDVARDS